MNEEVALSMFCRVLVGMQKRAQALPSNPHPDNPGFLYRLSHPGWEQGWPKQVQPGLIQSGPQWMNGIMRGDPRPTPPQQPVIPPGTWQRIRDGTPPPAKVVSTPALDRGQRTTPGKTSTPALARKAQGEPAAPVGLAAYPQRAKLQR